MKEKNIPLWRDRRVMRIALQVGIVFILVIIVGFFGDNLVNNYQQRGLQFGFDFLNRSANFDIGEKVIPYEFDDSNALALLVGLLNSLRVIILGIIIATILGITVGIARLSDNWLASKISAVFVEILRNTPLLLQLLFWYFAVFLKLPRIDNPLIFADSIFLTNRGMNIPWFMGNQQSLIAGIVLILSIVLAIFIWRKKTQMIVNQGVDNKLLQVVLIGIAIEFILVFLLGLDWQFPSINNGGNIEGGLQLSPEFAAILIGLSVYTAAYIAEVVRGGILSVDKGQWEAAKTLGLKPNLIMGLVIFPQALRVIIPSLTSEFLNLTKNSSLAIAILYSDIYGVSLTISENVNEHSIEIVLIVMVVYLVMNLFTSLVMNWFNSRVQIK